MRCTGSCNARSLPRLQGSLRQRFKQPILRCHLMMSARSVVAQSMKKSVSICSTTPAIWYRASGSMFRQRHVLNASLPTAGATTRHSGPASHRIGTTPRLWGGEPRGRRGSAMSEAILIVALRCISILAGIGTLILLMVAVMSVTSDAPGNARLAIVRRRGGGSVARRGLPSWRRRSWPTL